MTQAPPAHLLLAILVDELTRCGLTDACTSPGSRSTPLVLALARQPGLRCHSVLDERVAGFFGLGLAKASGRPVVLACTSGTAAAEYAPAVHEAREARVPLIVLTADRPAELRDVGAGQTIDQIDLYGRATGWFVELSALEQAPAERRRWIRTLACRLWWAASGAGGARPGPVQVNVPLREPLAPGAPVDRDEVAAGARPGRAPWVSRPPLVTAPDTAAVAALVPQAPARGVVVAGRLERHPGLAGALTGFVAATGYPLLADPLSGARGTGAVAAYDALLRHEPTAQRLRPELVIRVGDLPTSKSLRHWLAASGALQVALDPDGGWQDPDGVTAALLGGDPASVLAALGGLLPPAPPDWCEAWADVAERGAAALAGAVGAEDLSEPAVAAELGAVLPDGVLCWLASSMPIRDAESFWPGRERPLRALSNRGANGIDGTVASALGAAATGAPVVVLLGDLALAYDAGALLAGARLGLRLVLVVLDNRGGGIFHFLPVAGERDIFEEHVATPHPIDLAALAATGGATHVPVASLAALRAALDTALAAPASTLISVASDRRENVVIHARAWAAVADALG